MDFLYNSLVMKLWPDNSSPISFSGVLGVHAVVCHACVVRGYSSVMLRIAAEVAGRVCDVGCSIFSQTVDRLPLLTADRKLASHNAVPHVCQKYYIVRPLFVCTYKLFSEIQFFDVMVSSI